MESIPNDYPERIRRIRERLGYTQIQLADLLGVSFATVNRWENRQARPSRLAWSRLEQLVSEDTRPIPAGPPPAGPPV